MSFLQVNTVILLLLFLTPPSVVDTGTCFTKPSLHKNQKDRKMTSTTSLQQALLYTIDQNNMGVEMLEAGNYAGAIAPLSVALKTYKRIALKAYKRITIILATGRH
jgi:hypothetical protein